MMKTLLSTLAAGVLLAGAGQAATVVLNLPGNGSHASGTTFSTSSSYGGATFDIRYTLNAFATIGTPAPFIGSDGTIFGVGSFDDGSIAGQLVSIDGDDGEQLSMTNLSITNFNAGSSGLVVGDLKLSFNTLDIANGTAANDGITLSFTAFGDTTVGVDQPTTINLTALSNFSSTATSLYLQPDNAASNNRWSISGITASVTPEPSSTTLFGLGLVGVLLRRRRR